jgi:tRNA threonylcarbamoyladenosine biosynthesis protein TsaB
VKILALDCATEYCSAALWVDGVTRERSAPPARGLADNLLGWVQSLLSESGLGLRQLDLVAFGRGPGAFTGVRMAASLAQGLALSCELPVAPVSILRAIAMRAFDENSTVTNALPCQDARMNEVYWANYQRAGQGATSNAVLKGAENLSAPGLVPLDDMASGAADSCIACGSGFTAYVELHDRWKIAAASNGALVPLPLNVPPRAREIAHLAAIDGLTSAVAPELALPVYLRNNVASPAPQQLQ